MSDDEERSNDANTEARRAASTAELLRQYDLQRFSPPPDSVFEQEALDALKDGFPKTYKRFRRDGLVDYTVKRLGESAAMVASQVWKHLVDQGDAPGPALTSALDVARSQMQDDLRFERGLERTGTCHRYVDGRANELSGGRGPRWRARRYLLAAHREAPGEFHGAGNAGDSEEADAPVRMASRTCRV